MSETTTAAAIADDLPTTSVVCYYGSAVLKKSDVAARCAGGLSPAQIFILVKTS